MEFLTLEKGEVSNILFVEALAITSFLVLWPRSAIKATYTLLTEEGSPEGSCLLWKLIENMDRTVPGMAISELQFELWFRRLLLSRDLIFG